MSQPHTEIAWMLVRKASDLPDKDIIAATNIHPVTLHQMRQRHTAMVDAGTQSRQSWTLDSPPYEITHMDTYEAPEE